MGAFEEMVLLTLVRQGEAAYGVSIRRELEERAGNSVSMGAVYATLDRLESKALVRSRVGEERESRRGRPRRYYTVLPAGVRELQQTRAVRERMWAGIELDQPAEPS
ncbi:MAG: PadR family transcriptional regulator [Acidobacteria bacterium]|nr:PadR family transcriptional regulator [Acidobacteriota bacterium]